MLLLLVLGRVNRILKATRGFKPANFIQFGMANLAKIKGNKFRWELRLYTRSAIDYTSASRSESPWWGEKLSNFWRSIYSILVAFFFTFLLGSPTLQQIGFWSHELILLWGLCSQHAASPVTRAPWTTGGDNGGCGSNPVRPKGFRETP